MKWLLLALTLPLVLVAGGLFLNRPPLLSPPGVLERLKVYLTTNVAETHPEHRFPELRTPLVPLDARETRTAVLAAMQELGWQQVEVTSDGVQAVVVSPLFRFRDDLTVRLEETGGRTRLNARSASRIGKGDLAANARHLRELFAAVDRLAIRR